jgi:hypothetical protein
VELAPAEVASALAECAHEALFRTLKARAPASLRLELQHVGKCSLGVLRNRLPVRVSPGSRINAFQAFVTTLQRAMVQPGTATGTGDMLTLTMVASSSLSTGFGAD